MTTMTRPAPTGSEAEVVSTSLPVANGGTHEQEAPKRPTILEMKTYVQSQLNADPLSRREQGPTRHTFDLDSRSLHRPNSRRCRSWPRTQSPRYPSASERRPQSRRRSICMSDGGRSQYLSGDTEATGLTVDFATVDRWVEDFHEAKVAEWQQTVAEFSQAWKGWCFVQCLPKGWQDDLIKKPINNFWQPLSDFNYVLSVYSFLEGVRNCNLRPDLRPMYMKWRSPEQVRFHESHDLERKEDGPFEKSLSSNDMSGDNGSRLAASKYPLTRQQHLRVARICGDVAGRLKELRHCFDMFRNYRQVYAMASKTPDLSSAVMAEHRRRVTDAARQFSSLSKTMTSQLRDSRTLLCEALGLDPEQVPGGDTASIPTMAATKYKKVVETRSPCQRGPALTRGFHLKKASLQASCIALKANLYITLLPYNATQRILERMMAKSMKMATLANEAGDHKAEAQMRRLQNEIRKISERASQEFPGLKPRMTLLDSETWPAVLNPREDMQLEIHGDVSLPVETLIDMLHQPQVPEGVPPGTPGGPSNLPSAGSITTASENSPTTQANGH